ncbi:Hypothetical predicted protein, partial [Marmota monax]
YPSNFSLHSFKSSKRVLEVKMRRSFPDTVSPLVTLRTRILPPLVRFRPVRDSPVTQSTVSVPYRDGKHVYTGTTSSVYRRVLRPYE